MNTGHDEWEMIAFAVLTNSATPAQRTAFDQLSASDPSFAELVDELRVLLTESDPSETPVAPPEGLFDEIIAEIDAMSDDESDAVPPRKPVSVSPAGRGPWPVLTLLSSLIAIIAIGSHFAPFGAQPAAGTQETLAVLSDQDRPKIVVLVYDSASQRLLARYENVELPEDRVWQLWLIREGETVPEPVGVFDARLAPQTVGLPFERPKASQNDTFAISLEPLGGAPGAVPTGPIVFTGKVTSL